MSVTYSTYTGTIYESVKMDSVNSVLINIPNNTRKLIMPKDYRSGIYTSYENITFKPTSISASIVEYVGIDQSTFKEKIFFGKKQISGLRIMNNTVLNSDVDIFLFNTKSDTDLTQQDTKIAILSGTSSSDYEYAPYISSLRVAGTIQKVDTTFKNPNLSGGNLNLTSDYGRVNLNGLKFPSITYSFASASDGYSLIYRNGTMSWELGSGGGGDVIGLSGSMISLSNSVYTLSLTVYNDILRIVSLSNSIISLSNYIHIDGNLVTSNYNKIFSITTSYTGLTVSISALSQSVTNIGNSVSYLYATLSSINLLPLTSSISSMTSSILSFSSSIDSLSQSSYTNYIIRNVGYGTSFLRAMPTTMYSSFTQPRFASVGTFSSFGDLFYLSGSPYGSYISIANSGYYRITTYTNFITAVPIPSGLKYKISIIFPTLYFPNVRFPGGTNIESVIRYNCDKIDNVGMDTIVYIPYNLSTFYLLSEVYGAAGALSFTSSTYFMISKMA